MVFQFVYFLSELSRLYLRDRGFTKSKAIAVLNLINKIKAIAL
jgi:hypothetical protein